MTVVVWLVHCEMEYGWTLDKPYWTALKNTLGEESKWHIVRLRVNGGTAIPEKPGIYMLCSNPLMCEKTFVMNVGPPKIKELYNVMYIGESQNINTRYKKYANGTEKRPKVKKYLDSFSGNIDFCYWIMEGLNKPTLVNLQDLMILCFGPTANTQGGSSCIMGIGLNPAPA